MTLLFDALWEPMEIPEEVKEAFHGDECACCQLGPDVFLAEIETGEMAFDRVLLVKKECAVKHIPMPYLSSRDAVGDYYAFETNLYLILASLKLAGRVPELDLSIEDCISLGRLYEPNNFDRLKLPAWLNNETVKEISAGTWAGEDQRNKWIAMLGMVAEIRLPLSILQSAEKVLAYDNGAFYRIEKDRVPKTYPRDLLYIFTDTAYAFVAYATSAWNFGVECDSRDLWNTIKSEYPGYAAACDYQRMPAVSPPDSYDVGSLKEIAAGIWYAISVNTAPQLLVHGLIAENLLPGRILQYGDLIQGTDIVSEMPVLPEDKEQMQQDQISGRYYGFTGYACALPIHILNLGNDLYFEAAAVIRRHFPLYEFWGCTDVYVEAVAQWELNDQKDCDAGDLPF